MKAKKTFREIILEDEVTEATRGIDPEAGMGYQEGPQESDMYDTPADEGQAALDAENDVESEDEDADTYSDEFDDMLDQEGDVEIAGISFQRSRILKELDPIAYDQGLLDFQDHSR